jgi:hypothetical protein
VLADFYQAPPDADMTDLLRGPEDVPPIVAVAPDALPGLRTLLDADRRLEQ